MSTTHTPGPYMLRKLDAKDRRGRGSNTRKDVMFEIEPASVYPRKDKELWPGQGGPPAFTICRIPFDSGCEGDAEANARLLAAAPDLLTACQAQLRGDRDAAALLKRAVRNATEG
jgi:hypothetical protein